jgi:membrane protein DedA with SNARE-associated domain
MGAEFLLAPFIQYGYWLVFAGILLDNAGLPIPGEFVLMAFGALVRTGHVDAGLGLLVATVAAMSGDSAAYWMGRLGGDRLLGTYCRLTLGSGQCVRRATAFYRLHGSAAVVLGRFVIGVRAFLFPLAGSARMPYSRFLLFDGVGALIWVGVFLVTGYSIGGRVEAIYSEYRTGAMILAGTLGAAFGVYLVMKLYGRWRRGPASLRGPMIARVEMTLRPQSDRTPITPTSIRSPFVRVEEPATTQVDLHLQPRCGEITPEWTGDGRQGGDECVPAGAAETCAGAARNPAESARAITPVDWPP